MNTQLLPLAAGLLCAGVSGLAGMIATALLWRRWPVGRLVALGLGLAAPGALVLAGVLMMPRATEPTPTPARASQEQSGCVALPTLADGSFATKDVLRTIYGTEGEVWAPAAFRDKDKDYRGEVRDLRVVATISVRSLGSSSRLVLSDGLLSDGGRTGSFEHVLGAMILHEVDGRWCATGSSPAIHVQWGQNWSIGEVIPLDDTRDGVVVTGVAPDGDVAEEESVVVSWSPDGRWIVYREQARLIACDPDAGCQGFGADLVTRRGADGATEIYRRPWRLNEDGEQVAEAEERLIWKDGALQTLSTSGAPPEIGTSDGPWELSADRAAELGVPAGTWTATWIDLTLPFDGKVLGALQSRSANSGDVLIGAAVFRASGEGASTSWTLVSKNQALFAVPGWGASNIIPDPSPHVDPDDLDMMASGPGPWLSIWWLSGAEGARGGTEEPAEQERRASYIYEVDGEAEVLVDVQLGRYVGPQGLPVRRAELWYVGGGPSGGWPAVAIGTCAYDPQSTPPRLLYPVEVAIHQPSSPPTEPARWTLPPSAALLPNAAGAAACAAPEGSLPSPITCATWEDAGGAHLVLLAAEAGPVEQTPTGPGEAQTVTARAEVWDLGGDVPVRSWSAEALSISCDQGRVMSVDATPALRTDVDGDGMAELALGVHVGCEGTGPQYHLVVAEGTAWTWERGRLTWVDGARSPSTAPPPLPDLAVTMAELLSVRCPDPRGE